MSRDNIVFTACGLLLGLIIGSFLIGPHLAQSKAPEVAADAPPPQAASAAPGNPMEAIRNQIASLKDQIARDPRNVDALMQLRPREASLVRDGSEARVPIDALRIDDVVKVRPGERFPVDGAGAITTEYGRWFAHPGRFSELRRIPTADGEVVEYTLRWTEDGVPYAAHHVHVLTVDRAREQITTDRVWCGGRWDAHLLAQMG